MAVKNSFVLYADYLEQFEMLSMEERGRLITAILLYVSDKELPEMNGAEKMAFSFIRSTLDKHNQKYKGRRETRANEEIEKWISAGCLQEG